MSSMLCLTCSAPLSDVVPSSSEKPLPPNLPLGCGRHSICGACQLRSVRYARGDAQCLMCTDAMSLLSAPSNGAKRSERVDAGEDAFVLGGDDSDDDNEEVDPPPAYDDFETQSYMLQDSKQSLQENTTVNKEDTERNSIHYVRPDETLAGLALKYRVPGSMLCRMNRLPLTTLNTTPQLIHTRPFLVLPPTAKSTSTEPVRTEEEERRRLMIRRFQMETKASHEVAKAYLDSVTADREKEIQLVNSNRLARGESALDQVRTGGELNEAVERWKDDERWERENSVKLRHR